MKFLQLLLIAVCCSFLGCGGSSVSSQMAAYNKENIQKCSTMYTVYSSMNGFVGPKDAEEMKAFLTSDEGAMKRLGFVGIDTGDLDQYMVGRDGLPLKFRWGVKTTPVSAPYPICFEEEGVDGVRQVGLSGARIQEVTDDEEYETLLKGKYRPDAEEKYNPSLDATE